MPYIIDGHNLIPKIPGIQLRDIDDEYRLIEKLQEFTRRVHKKVEVYFDQAPPGKARRQSSGLLTVFFVREGTTADQAIHRRVKSLKKESGNWTVVSSDQSVQSSARELGARVMTSAHFAAMMKDPSPQSPRIEKPAPSGLDGEELAYWLNFFGEEG